jgi:uncharacterized membrane protein
MIFRLCILPHELAEARGGLVAVIRIVVAAAVSFALAVVIVVAYSWFGAGSVHLRIWPFDDVVVSIWVLGFGSLALGLALGIPLGFYIEDVTYTIDEITPQALIPWLVPMALCLLLFGAVRAGTIEAGRAILVMICGWIALLASISGIRSLARGDPFQIEPQVNIGGGSGGWRVSSNLILLLIGILFVIATFAALQVDIRVGAQTRQTKKVGPSAPHTASSAPPQAGPAGGASSTAPPPSSPAGATAP